MREPPASEAARTDLDQARRLERALIRVRWFGVVLGVYLVSQTNTGFPPFASRGVLAFAYALMGLLAAGNVAILLAVRRIGTLEGMQRLGVTAFLFDAVVIFGLAWAYSYDPRSTQWVVIYILPLEGALRYQLRGALAAVGMALVNEFAREAYLAARFTVPRPEEFIPRYPFQVANVIYRVGLEALVASVAGFMSRSLALQRDRAAEAAERFEDVARKESDSRAELAAFNTAILTGVAAEDLDRSLRLMAEAIGRDLGFDSLTIMLREGDALAIKANFGLPDEDLSIPVGVGVTGTVAETGRPLVVPDVHLFPGYIEADPRMRSEMAAPMRIGDEVIGVVDVQSRHANDFSHADLGMLTRLADQIALVAHSNRLLSQQKETLRRLQELDQMKLDFVAITSHELRTPITAIRGFVKTLQRNRAGLSPEQVDHFLAIIDRQSARLARLVDDLLFVSRIEAGAVKVRRTDVDLAAFLRDSVESLGPEGRSRIEVEVEPDHPTVWVDPQRVDQVLRNLVENALKFSDPTSRVFVSGCVQDGEVEIAVKDHGVGIAQEDLPFVFDRFHQAGQVMTRASEGAGLGLYITRQLVGAMGGAISVSSTPGEGSTFRVRLPNVAPDDGRGDGDAHAQAASEARSAPNAAPSASTW